MPRWLIPLLFVLALFTRIAPAQDPEIIVVLPGDGVSIPVGGYIYVDNWTSHPALVVIKRADGTVVTELLMAPKSHRDIKLPKDPSLIGQKLTTTATAGPLTASSTNPIVAPGMAEDDSNDVRLETTTANDAELVPDAVPVAIA